jgi:cell division protein FtsL
MVHRRTSRFDKLRGGWRVILPLVLFGLFGLLCAASVVYPSIRARYLFAQLEKLQLGVSSAEQARELASRIHAERSATCDASQCEWVKKIDNAYLPGWWRGPGATFAIVFEVSGSTVVRKVSGFGTALKGEFHPSQVSVEEQQHWGREHRDRPTWESFQAGWYTTDRFRYYWFQVRMTQKTPSEERRRFTSFNYFCLSKFRGCQDGREFLPASAAWPVGGG